MDGTRGNKELSGTLRVAFELTLRSSAHAVSEICPSMTRPHEIGCGTDLLTFCPPGPLDRLNDTSQIWRGIDLEWSFVSHSLAALSSASSGSPACRAAELLDAKDFTATECALGMERGWANANMRTRWSDIIFSAYCPGHRSSAEASRYP
jgi:hypothetical protein